MKNLKKVLALVLTVAMVLSFTIAASATFKDADSINYKEAVDVMAGIGVINGFTDGNFKPAANVTRAQMAKMVAYILNKGTDVGSLYASANTFTDCTNHWAKGYIAYAAKTGIVAGMGDGTFNPEGSVTGTQAAKMLLCALGYDATIEGYVGANWNVNVLNDASDAGLLKNLTSVDMSKALTREQAAQMMYNALKATMVKYSSKGSNITINGVTIAQGASDAESVKIDNEGSANYAGNASGAAGLNTQQLCEKYFEKLKLGTTTDDFGVPADEWTYPTATDTIATSAKYTAVKTYKEGFTAKELATLRKTYTIPAGVTTLVNGEAVSGATVDAVAAREYKGTVVELYATNDDASKTITLVVVKQVYAAKVTSLNSSTISLKVYNPWLDMSAREDSRTLSFTNDKDKTDDNYDTLAASFKKDDYLLVYFKAADLSSADNFIKAVAAKSITGKVATTDIGALSDGYNGSFTVDGTKYTLASGYNEVELKAGSSYTFYTDENGYVIAAVADSDTTAITDVYYVAYVWPTNDTTYNTPVEHAQLVGLDGKITAVELETKLSGENTVPYDSAAVQGKLVTMSDKKISVSGTEVCKASDKKYNLTEWDPTSDWDKNALNTTGNTATFTKSATRVSAAGTTYRLDSNTQYILVSKTGSSLAASLKTGGIAYSYAKASGKYAYIITEKDATFAKYVLIADSGASITEGQTYSSDAIFISKTTTSAGDGYYSQKIYKADGSTDTWQTDAQYDQGFYTYDKNSDGYYTLDEATTMTVGADLIWTTDKPEGTLTGTYSALYNTLLTVQAAHKVEDVETSKAVFVDVHDTDGTNQYTGTIGSLADLKDLVDNNEVGTVTLKMNVSSTGAVIIFVTSAAIYAD